MKDQERHLEIWRNFNFIKKSLVKGEINDSIRQYGVCWGWGHDRNHKTSFLKCFCESSDKLLEYIYFNV